MTIMYPDEQPDVPLGFRGLPVLLSDDEGNLKCVSCHLCVRACPVELHRDSGPPGRGNGKRSWMCTISTDVVHVLRAVRRSVSV